MSNSCCVPGCAVVRRDGVFLHIFPNPLYNIEKFTSWVSKIGGQIASMDHRSVFQNRRVCHRHFEDIHKYPNGRLSKLAIPTLHIPDLQAQPPAEAMVVSNSDTFQKSPLSLPLASTSNATQSKNFVSGLTQPGQSQCRKKRKIEATKSKRSPNSTNTQTAMGITTAEKTKDRFDATWTLVKRRQGGRKAPKTTTDTAQPSSSTNGTDGESGRPKAQISIWSIKQTKRRLKRQQRRTETKTTAGNKRAHLVVQVSSLSTISRQGEHKKLRIEKSGPALNSYAETAKSDLAVAVTLASSEHLTREQGDFLVDALQKRVLTEARLGLERGPAFRGKPLYTEGTLRLWCYDNHTLKWLNTAVIETTLPSGEHLIVKKQADIPKKVRCGILIPGISDKPDDIGRTLAYQNPWVKMEKWLLHAAMKQETDTFLVVSIPEDQVPTILSHERRLGYMLGSVYIKFQGQKGKFTETFPGGEGNSSAVEPTPMDAIEPANEPELAPGTSSATRRISYSGKPIELSSDTSEDDSDILSNDGIPFVKIDQCAIKLLKEHGQGCHRVILTSVCMPESEDLPPYGMTTLVDYCEKGGLELIIAADSNAYHPLCGMENTNSRGTKKIKREADSDDEYKYPIKQRKRKRNPRSKIPLRLKGEVNFSRLGKHSHLVEGDS